MALKGFLKATGVRACGTCTQPAQSSGEIEALEITNSAESWKTECVYALKCGTRAVDPLTK